jgi:predicted DNA-binding helix-hairpin-helix protein
MTTDFLVASSEAKKALQTAKARHARLKAQADERLAGALTRHRSELAVAAAVEAAAWRELMKVPGMTVATAARIGETPVSTVRRWLSTPAPDAATGSSCS